MFRKPLVGLTGVSRPGHEYLKVALLLQDVTAQCQNTNNLNALLYQMIMDVLLGLPYSSLTAFHLLKLLLF